MSDEGHRTIDKAYDAAERVVDGIGRVLGVDTRTSSDVAAPAIARLKDANVRAALPANATKALPAAPPEASASFRIVETISETGVKIFTVTNGTVTADCKSRAFAEQVFIALTAKLAGTAIALPTQRGRRHA